MNTIIKHMRQVEEGMTLLDVEKVEGLAAAMVGARKMGGRVYVFGNGGSAATASHVANDLMKICGVRAICLNDMYPVVSAYGNDEGWMDMYLLPLSKLFDVQKDVAFGISCGGNSENVVRALVWVVEKGGCGIGLTGQDMESRINKIGLSALAHAMVPDIRVQEDIHMIVCHAMVRAIQEAR